MPDAPNAAAEVADRLASNAVDSLPKGALAERLIEATKQNRQLRVKLGIDPTAPDIHLGHAVVLKKLREFQDAGHKVVLIVGDYTARVGDPSGRSAERPILTDEEIEANTERFKQQAMKILTDDPNLLEVRRNGEWLDMPMVDFLKLARTTTAAQLLERDDFSKRLAAGTPISMLELLYPLLQGYDSVAIEADVELGGTDQKFNLLLGRDIQRAYGQPEQAIMTVPILVGLDGHRKMSKSLGNHIPVTAEPEDMYGKAMSLPDEAMASFFELLFKVDAPREESPRDAKRRLARQIVSWLHSPEDAERAEEAFDRVFARGELPEDIPDASFEAKDGRLDVPALMAKEFGLSRSEARRLIDQGGVSLGDEPFAAGEYDADASYADGLVLRVGKRRFRRLRSL
jgi:tyrosyl-tRNA synthetase